jgi:hypothetical protein
MILAADALSGATPASGLFRGAELPLGLQTDFDCICVTT